jgi:flagellar assembly protein FliH
MVDGAMPERARAPRILDHAEEAGRPFTGALSAVAPDPVAEAVARAREEGRAEGHREALAEAEEERVRFRAEAAASLKRLADLQDSLTRQHESDLLEIALEAASRIVRARIEASDPVVVRAVREAAEALPAAAGAKVRVHPSDLDVLARELTAEVDRGRIQFAPDETLTPGGCVVESSVGTVDATIETACDAVRSAARGTAELR